MLIQVGELAKRAGITVRTLHHYEQTGVLLPSARSAAGYRLYNLADVQRLHMIRALAKAGLELAEIRDYGTGVAVVNRVTRCANHVAG